MDKRHEAGTKLVLDPGDDFEFALKLFRADSMMAKAEARRRRHFIPPSARRKLKAATARKRAARARRKRTERAS
ncbi:MAG TPA: 30S ribosomal protein S21 [Candidatus Dormibacteraeota bacterium]